MPNRPELNFGYEYIGIRYSDTSSLVERGLVAHLIGSTIASSWVTITSSNNNLRIVKNSDIIDVTLPIGNDLSPFFIAYYISRELLLYNMECYFLNNAFLLRTNSPSDNFYVTEAPSNDANSALAFPLDETVYGTTSNNTFNGTVALSGMYLGLETETYWIKVSGNSIFELTPDADNIYRGILAVGGTYESNLTTEYTITIDTSNGASCSGEFGSSPKFSVISSGDDTNTPQNCEILSYDAWYSIGTKGVKIKFSPYSFGNGDSFIVNCTPPQSSDGTNNSSELAATKFIIITDSGKQYEPSLLINNTLSLPKGLTLTFTEGTEDPVKGDTFIVKSKMEKYEDVTTLDMGSSGQDENSNLCGIRVLVKSGTHRIKWAKVGVDNPGGNLIDLGYTGSCYRLGTVGVANPKNGNEVLTSYDINSAQIQFSDFFNYLEPDMYVHIPCTAIHSDPWYMVFHMGHDEFSGTVNASMKVLIGYE